MSSSPHLIKTVTINSDLNYLLSPCENNIVMTTANFLLDVGVFTVKSSRKLECFNDELTGCFDFQNLPLCFFKPVEIILFMKSTTLMSVFTIYFLPKHIVYIVLPWHLIIFPAKTFPSHFSHNYIYIVLVRLTEKVKIFNKRLLKRKVYDDSIKKTQSYLLPIAQKLWT